MTKRGRPPHPDILIPREWQVLELLREGLSNEEIAQRLGISLAGAKYHVSEILGKLAVTSREKAAAWEPTERPWWATALAPMGFLWRKSSVSWLSPALAGALFVVLVAGVGLLAWGLLRTSGDTAPVGGQLARVTVIRPGATPTAIPKLPPLPTPRPFVAEPVDCPGGHATPEEAIEGCLRSFSWFSGHRYAGDCDMGGHPFPALCSFWAEGASSPRTYKLWGLGPDTSNWMLLERRDEGWVPTHWASCGAQGLIEVESKLCQRAMDLA